MGEWGIIPGPVLDLLEALSGKIREGQRVIDTTVLPCEPGDIAPALLITIRATEQVHEASKDLRSALSAYAHKCHSPRPLLRTVAAAQNTSVQGLVRRYTAATETALTGLIEGTATVGDLTRAFRSLTPADAELLLTISTKPKRGTSRSGDPVGERIQP